MDLGLLAREHGEKPAIVVAGSGARLSYRELDEQSNRIAHLFRDRGLVPGDHIAVLMENRVELLPVVFAAQRAGLLYTPVNWHLRPDEAAYIVSNCQARILVYSHELSGLAHAALAQADAVESVYVVGGPDGTADLATAASAYSDGPIADSVEGAYMLYSSGTTDQPKGIVPTMTGNPFGTGLAIDHMMRSAFGFSSDGVYLSPGPLYHAAPLGWTMGTIRNGGTAIVLERFDAEDVLAAIDTYGVTHAQFVPTMFVRMLKLPAEVRSSHDVSSLQVVVHAAAPCPVAVKRQMIEWFGPIIVEFYSGSEGTGFFMIDTAEWLTHPGSVGKAVLGVPHICDDEGRELPPGEVGTIWFSDVTRFEYHGEPGKTAAAFNSQGWNTLGDLGYLDADGYLYLSARRTDLIISGGVNIYPQEIEDALIMHPDVADAAVLGVADDEMGQRVFAVVEPTSPGRAGPDLEAELVAYLRERIAGYKVPRGFAFDLIPRLPSGKILRRNLSSRFDTTDPRA
ncbi:AMP-binding protein [Gordonia sp. KTR9]|uniref:AMP-binding protein n=1 Tax=Gordonia sp. KTR9 TaxID=337191 RepID=UPI0005CAD752|nr:AMP-binding protein [Gordonia sp. KTR9]